MSESTKEYPRVLVVAAQPINHEPHGLMMANLFRNWPLDRIAQVHGGLEDPCPEMCRRHWRVGSADVPIDRLVRRVIGKRRDQLLGRPSAGLPAALGRVVAGGPSRIRAAVHEIASSWADCLRFHLSREFWDWVADFRPDVIYSLLGRIRVMDIVLRIADRCSKPVVPHIMDDWPSTHYRGTPLSLIPRRILLSRFRAVLRRSPVGMGIGEAMAEEFRRRYAVPFAAFMNCVEAPGQCPQPPSRGKNKPVEFLYVGGLHLGRSQSLQEVGETLAALRDDGLKGEVVVYAPAADIARHGRHLAATPATRVGGSLAAEDVMPRIQAADVLLHVESFDGALRKRTRLSVSTKIPQYMSSGRPILAYGPGEVASCRYIEQCDCGRVVGKRDSAALTKALRELVSDAELRTRLGQRGWEVASQRHDADSQRERFRQLLVLAASGEVRSITQGPSTK